ncbi:mucin-22-like isoform X2 [Ptychodera flava]|uniref:mucin-22-like isoform X2 n=1 Tax=Ptychodera flava TaxID=63121 RepID=UPI00396A42F4
MRLLLLSTLLASLCFALADRSTQVNIALGKRVWGRGKPGHELLVDGDPDTCRGTGYRKHATVGVDLGRVYQLQKVQLTLNKKTIRNYAKARIRAGNFTKPDKNPVCFLAKGKNKGLVFGKPCEAVARYVFVQKVGRWRSLSLCEIKVFAEEADVEAAEEAQPQTVTPYFVTWPPTSAQPTWAEYTWSQEPTSVTTGIGETGEGFVPTTEGVVPTTEGVIPTTEGVIPTTEGVIPTTEGVIPTTEGVIPTTEGVIPTTEGVIPTTEGVIPTTEGVVPTTEGVFPTTEGVNRTTKGVIPTEGAVLTTKGVVATTQGVIPTIEEVVPTTEGMVPTTEGEVPTTEVEAPTAEGDDETTDEEIPTAEEEEEQTDEEAETEQEAEVDLEVAESSFSELEVSTVPNEGCELPNFVKNMAEGHHASQISTDGGNLAQKAVDGIPDGHLEDRQSCSMTNREYQPWWKVDLQESIYIYQIVLINRIDCCSKRLKNAEIRIGDNENFEDNPICGTVKGHEAKRANITIVCGCDVPMKGRYVSIQLIDRTNILQLCEVIVLGAA